MTNKPKLRKKRLAKQDRIVEWHRTKSSARYTARLRQMPIVEVEQPRGRPPLYGFGGKSKVYYVVTSAPKTLIATLERDGIKAKEIKFNTTKNRKRLSSR